MTKKLIVGSPQAMAKERSLDPPEPETEELGDDPKYRKGYADGVREVIDYVNNFGQ